MNEGFLIISLTHTNRIQQSYVLICLYKRKTDNGEFVYLDSELM